MGDAEDEAALVAGDMASSEVERRYAARRAGAPTELEVAMNKVVIDQFTPRERRELKGSRGDGHDDDDHALTLAGPTGRGWHLALSRLRRGETSS
jgi:hypothetical protein